VVGVGGRGVGVSAGRNGEAEGLGWVGSGETIAVGVGDVWLQAARKTTIKIKAVIIFFGKAI